VIPWELLDTAAVPDGGSFRLMRRGDEYSIMVGGNELMNSRRSGSEVALATLACQRLRERAGAQAGGPAMLIGGLGMGFTLRAALGELGADARVVVAELVPAVVTWARGPLATVFGEALSDPRVTLHEGDVGDLIRPARQHSDLHSDLLWDAILLDVDNGPGGVSREANNRLYGAKGLAEAHAALRPGGVLAVWSAHPDDPFTGRLRQTGFSVEELRTRANGPRGGRRHIIWIATRT
jgi:spermidine synthase